MIKPSTKDKNETVTCIKCGISGRPELMAHVGHNAYKCVYCLFNNKEK